MITDVKTSYNIESLRELISRRAGPERVPKKLRIIDDTSDFFRVDYDDVVILGERPYLVRNYEKEGRFAIEEQPKFWVRRAIDLLDGKTKIIKMVFHERFKAKVGEISFDCVRSPKKEARILDIVRGHHSFMQGFAVKDAAGNIIRIVDFIHGKTLAEHVLETGSNHEDYFYNHFACLLEEFIELVEAINFLHKHNEKHGDIRRDHIIKDNKTGKYKWIDFDFNYWHKENMFGYDLFGLGNVFIYLAGRGDVTVQQISKEGLSSSFNLNSNDLNIIFKNRIVNLKKIYGYIPESINLILLHFSRGAGVFYDKTEQLLTDLQEARNELKK